MPIDMPKGLPFSVDTFTPSSKRKRHRFLTHAHKDHSTGIATHCSYPIYCTRLTKSIVLQQYPQLDECLFESIEVGQSIVVEDPDGEFTVTVFDANHCPGAVMFLFEGSFGNILHTGDCRLTPECLQNLPQKYIGRRGKVPQVQLDFVFLDCTFGKYTQKIPSKHSAIRQVINCIWKHPDAVLVYLTCDLLGQEEILADISRTFGSKIYIDQTAHLEFLQALKLTYPEIVSKDPSSRFHLFDGFPRLYERAKAKIEEALANSQPEPLIIRPSSQWYACEEGYSENKATKKKKLNEAVRDEFGVWHVCYSMHSSRDELEWALQLLAPKRVVSTTPHCRAMELNYVKKHCFSTKIASDDPLWKLLDISMEGSSNRDPPVIDDGCPYLVTEVSRTSTEYESKTVMLANPKKLDLSLSPARKKPHFTLFGRARVGLDSSFLPEENKKSIAAVGSQDTITEEFEKGSRFRDEENDKESCKKQELLVEECNIENCNRLETDVAEIQRERLGLEEKNDARLSHSFIGSSRSFSDNLRKMYRSMNVPVPQPLPSLATLMKSSKRVKRTTKFM